MRLDLDIGKLVDDQMRAVITATKENKERIVAAAKMTRYKSTLMVFSKLAAGSAGRNIDRQLSALPLRTLFHSPLLLYQPRYPIRLRRRLRQAFVVSWVIDANAWQTPLPETDSLPAFPLKPCQQVVHARVCANSRFLTGLTIRRVIEACISALSPLIRGRVPYGSPLLIPSKSN